MSWFLVLPFAAAAELCPSPWRADAVVSRSVTESGDAYVLVADTTQVCWWSVDDRDDATVVARWPLDDRHPLRLEALADGRAVLAMSDGRVMVRTLEGERRSLLALPGVERMLAHPQLPLVALVVDAAAPHVVVLDVDNGEVLAQAPVAGPDVGLAFRHGACALAIDDQVLELSGAWQSRR